MKKKISIYFLFLMSLLVLNACNLGFDDSLPDSIPQGEIWANVEGSFFRFNSNQNTQPIVANSYETNSKLTSIFRRTSIEYNKTFTIFIVGLDLDKITSFPHQVNSGLTCKFYVGNNEYYQGTENSLNFKITSLQNDVVKGTFSGTLTHQSNPSNRITVQGGEFYIKLDRF